MSLWPRLYKGINKMEESKERNWEDYFYEGTDVLKNKLDIRDDDLLFAAEKDLTSLRKFELEKSPVKGDYDFKHLCDIHRYLFQDVYEWAGEPRTVDMVKGSTIFCSYRMIAERAETAFNFLKEDKFLQGMDQEEFTGKVCLYMAEVNLIHAFREGNGRTQREFFEQLANQAGYEIGIEKWPRGIMNEAFAAATSLDYGPLYSLLKFTVNPLPEPERSRIAEVITSATAEATRRNEEAANERRTAKEGLDSVIHDNDIDLDREKPRDQKAPGPESKEMAPPGMKDRLAAAQNEADRRSAEKPPAQPKPKDQER